MSEPTVEELAEQLRKAWAIKGVAVIPDPREDDKVFDDVYAELKAGASLYKMEEIE